VNLVENIGRVPRDPVERRTVQAEMYAFVASLSLAPLGGGVYLRTRPIEKAANSILKEWQKMIQSALKHDAIFVAKTEAFLMWWKPKNRYVEQTKYQNYFEDAASRALARLLLTHGHLIKECPAPRLRGKPGEKCENIFVASRPNKVYCSSACQSRATTAENRANPKGKKKKTK
jgi:hypothetical protein